MNKRILSALAAAIILSQGAQAATATANLDVSATVQGACAISQAPAAMAFGNYFPSFSADLDQSTTFELTCATGAPYNINLNDGLNASGPLARRLSDGQPTASYVNYNLYRTTADRISNTPWGGLNSITGNGTGAAVSFTVYGRLFGGQTTAPAGSYTDTVVLTVTF